MEIPENTKQEAIKRLTDRYLFRGFSKEKKRWFFGSLTAIMLPSERFSTTIIYQDETKTYVQIEVDPESVGMFVLTFNNTKIYEGDIIHIRTKYCDKDFGVVTYNDEQGMFYIDEYFGKEKNRDCKPIGKFLADIENHFKNINLDISVNGNIYERK